MRYVPNLIPEKSKVLKDYFKDESNKSHQLNSNQKALGWIFGILFLLIALIYIVHPILSILFGLLGFILIPLGHRLIEQKLNFRLTNKLKLVFCTVLFISSIPLARHYKDIDKQEAKLEKAKDEQKHIEKEIAEKKNQIRKDSLDYYLQSSNSFLNEHKPLQANKQLTYALAFATSQEEKDLISNKQIEISKINAFDLVKSGKYKNALPELNNLIELGGNNSELLYNRAICYSKIGRIQDAVTDCKTAISLGNADAEKLHNKINPIKKRVSYYVTRCCDGSTSSTKGQGACSHHGGVCNWNEPVYEEYRKYE